jgi:hypothetical protein
MLAVDLARQHRHEPTNGFGRKRKPAAAAGGRIGTIAMSPFAYPIFSVELQAA